MATATITGRSAASATRERMTSVLDALASGLTPPPCCSACRASLSDHCPDCAQRLRDVADVNAAIGAVDAALTDEEAARIYDAVLPSLRVSATRGTR
jgi:predicted amidophosphoribosyltransferase